MSDEPEEDVNEEEPSFRERLEEAREQGPEGRGGPGGAPPGGGMQGNPFAQMMGGMMGGGMGDRMQEERRDTAVAKELAQLREDIQELTTQVERVADELEER